MEMADNNKKDAIKMEIFLNVVKVKQELDEDTSVDHFGTQDRLKNVRQAELKNLNLQNTATATSFPNTQSHTQDVKTSNDELSISKHIQIKTEFQISDIEIKTEALTCKVCFKESEEDICKECVQKGMKGIDSYSLLANEEIFANSKKASEQIESEILNFNEQIPIHTGGKPYSCDLSDYIESYESSKYQVQQMLNQVILPCDYEPVNKGKTKKTCGKKYKCDLHNYRTTSPYSIKHQFQARHINEKNSSLCRYKSVTKVTTQNHWKHTGEKLYKCDFCDDKFTCKFDLNSHIKRKHTSEKYFACNKCVHKFLTKQRLKKHMQKHINAKSYQCDICDYICFRSSHLQNHIRDRHTNERNFQCDICNYKCATKGSLTLHVIRKHRSKKILKCDLCDYQCELSAMLKLHIETRHKEQDDINEYKFITKGPIKQYLRKHTGEPKALE